MARRPSGSTPSFRASERLGASLATAAAWCSGGLARRTSNLLVAGAVARRDVRVHPFCRRCPARCSPHLSIFSADPRGGSWGRLRWRGTACERSGRAGSCNGTVPSRPGRMERSLVRGPSRPFGGPFHSGGHAPAPLREPREAGESGGATAFTACDWRACRGLGRARSIAHSRLGEIKAAVIRGEREADEPREGREPGERWTAGNRLGAAHRVRSAVPNPKGADPCAL